MHGPSRVFCPPSIASGARWQLRRLATSPQGEPPLGPSAMAALRRLQLDQLAECGLDVAEAAAVAALIGQVLAQGGGSGEAGAAPEVRTTRVPALV